MAHGIGSVGGKAYFKDRIGYHTEYLTTRLTYRQSAAQDHDSLMRVAQAKFIFGTNHPMTLLSADFAFLNLKGFTLFVIKGCPNSCHGHFLTFGYIGRPAYDRQDDSLSYLNLGKAEFVRIGVLGTFEYLAYNDPF